jgi:hypothetical protein
MGKYSMLKEALSLSGRESSYMTYLCCNIGLK